MYYMKKIWTPEQIEFLKKNYATLKTDEILKVLTDKNNDQLRWKAKEYKLQKTVTRSKSDIRFLEDFDNLESLYWWGFITADGCFCKNSLIIQLNSRDGAHLKKFSDKINANLIYRNRFNSFSGQPETIARVSVSDKFTILKLKEKLKITAQKTYNPFDISIFCSKERLIYFFAGMVDGDGHINSGRNARISIKVHPNWKTNFELISKGLKEFYQIDSNVKINNAGWLVLDIYRICNLQKLYSMIQNVPFMERKWSPLANLKYNQKNPASLAELPQTAS